MIKKKNRIVFLCNISSILSECIRKTKQLKKRVIKRPHIIRHSTPTKCIRSNFLWKKWIIKKWIIKKKIFLYKIGPKIVTQLKADKHEP